MSIINKIINKTNLSLNKQKMVINIFWAVLGKVVTLLGSLLVGIVVARYLGPEQYGLMNYVISYVTLFQILAHFGLDNIEITEESRHPNDKDIIIGTAFTLKSLFALLTMLLVIGTSFLFEADSFTRSLIILYSFSMLLSSFSVIRNYFTSIVWNEYIVKTEISRTLIGAGIKIGLLFLKAPLIWFVAATLFDLLLIAVGYYLAYTSKIGSVSVWKFDKVWAKHLLKHSFPLLLSGAAVVVYQKIDQVMIGNMIDKASVGQFSVAAKFVEIILFIPTIMTQTVTPMLVRLREKSQVEYERKGQIFVNITVWSSIIFAVLICLFAYPIVMFTYGDQYFAAVIVLQIMIFKSVGMALSASAGQMVVIEKIHQLAFIRNLIGCVVCVGCNLIIIPLYGIIGSAIVSVITALMVGWLANLLIPRYHKIFKMETVALFTGWKDLFRIKDLL